MKDQVLAEAHMDVAVDLDDIVEAQSGDPGERLGVEHDEGTDHSVGGVESVVVEEAAWHRPSGTRGRRLRGVSGFPLWGAGRSVARRSVAQTSSERTRRRERGPVANQRSRSAAPHWARLSCWSWSQRRNSAALLYVLFAFLTVRGVGPPAKAGEDSPSAVAVKKSGIVGVVEGVRGGPHEALKDGEVGVAFG